MNKLYTLLVILYLLPSISVASNYAPLDQLQTFLTSPDVRSQLNQQRDSGKYELNSDKNVANFLRKPLEVKMQGVVLREKHKPVIFVNDSNTLKSSSVNQQIKVKAENIKSNSVIIPIKVNTQPIKLKPGQQWNETDRKTLDNYQIKPSKDKPDGIATEIISKIIE